SQQACCSRTCGRLRTEMARVGRCLLTPRCLFCKQVMAHQTKTRRTMFHQLTEEVLDLEATTKGYGGALYAAVDPGGSCCGGRCNLRPCCACSPSCFGARSAAHAQCA